MQNITLQLQRLAGGSVPPAGNVLFDDTIQQQGNILYDPGTGVITLLEPGRYDIQWWVSIHSTLSPAGTAFALTTDEGFSVVGASASKTGEVSGSASITITTQPVELSLVNSVSTAALLSPNPMPKASLTLVFQPLNTGMSDTFTCYAQNQLAHLMQQMLDAYPGTPISTFSYGLSGSSGNLARIDGTPEYGPGMVVIETTTQYGLLPFATLCAVAFTGSGVTMPPDVTYLPLPDPVPLGCDTAMMVAIHDAIEIGVSYSFYVGGNATATGTVFANPYGVIVMAPSDGSTPIFISTVRINRIIVDKPPAPPAGLRQANTAAVIAPIAMPAEMEQLL